MTISEKSLLRDEFTRQRNSATSSQIGAPSCATTAQLPPTEPPSLLELARNRLRNKLATSSQNVAQQAPSDSDYLAATAQQPHIDDLAHWRWRVVFADGSAKIAAFTPPADRNEVIDVYPYAITAQKIPDNDLKNQPGGSPEF